MANQEHLDILNQGVEVWNKWRKDHPETKIDLSSTNFNGRDFSGADFSGGDFSFATFLGANLVEASFYEAYLEKTVFTGADLRLATFDAAWLLDALINDANLEGASLLQAFIANADFSRSILTEAYLAYALLNDSDFIEADLREADLTWSNLSGVDFSGADLSGCSIYGISAWDVDLTETKQSNLIITLPRDNSEEPIITVDNLEVAQFINLLLNNKRIGDVIDTITMKVVLILGRFTPERKAILDAIRDQLRKRNYIPVLFDFEKPASRDITETVSTLAHLARFVIADITDAKSIPQELMTIVPNLPSVPVQPLILSSQHEYGMFEHFTRFPWVLPVYLYQDQTSLLTSLKEHVIEPAEKKAKELEKR
jgi:uncharacterized protein YjbI with pentapeptide repeats